MKNVFTIGFTILVALISFSSLQAQDFIYLKNNTSRIAAEHINVGSNETHYRLFGEDSKAVFAIDNKEISLIAFEDGTVRYFQGEDELKSVYDYNKNLMTFHLFDLIVNQFTLSYERIISNGKIGIQIPVSLGFSDSDRNGFDDVQNKYYTGVNLNFYPTGQGRVRYCLGPGFQIGTATYDDTYYNSSQYVENHLETTVFRFLINNALIISPVKDMSLAIVGSIGVRYLDQSSEDKKEVKTVGAFAFNLSYRF